MSFRNLFGDLNVFSKIKTENKYKTSNKNISESDNKNKYQQFYEKWFIEFRKIDQIDIKTLPLDEATQLHLELANTNNNFLTERENIKTIRDSTEDKDSNVARTNQWYENYFLPKFNALKKMSENYETTNKKIEKINPEKAKNKALQEKQADDICDKWLQYFKVISTINLEALSTKEITVFREEFSKKADEFRTDKNDISVLQNEYIIQLWSEIEKKFEDEYQAKLIQIRKIEAYLCLNPMYVQMTNIMPPTDKMHGQDCDNITTMPEYNISSTLDGARKNFIRKIELNNDRLSRQLKFNEYAYEWKSKVECIKETYISVKNEFLDIEEPSIKKLLTATDNIFSDFEQLPSCIAYTKNKIEENKNTIRKYQDQLTAFEKIRNIYEHAFQILNRRIINYNEKLAVYNDNKIKVPKINSNISWDEMFSCKDKIKLCMEIESIYLEDLENFYAFRTSFVNMKTLNEKIAELNTGLSKISFDHDSLNKIKDIDNAYDQLKDNVKKTLEKSRRKLIKLKHQRDELKKQMIDLENKYLISGEYSQVRYLKFTAIKQYILKNKNLKKLKKYGTNEKCNKQKEIEKYILQIEKSDNLRDLFFAVQCDLKFKASLFSLRQNQNPSSLIGYSLFHLGKSTTDNYALSLESDLIKYTEGICGVSHRETDWSPESRFTLR